MPNTGAKSLPLNSSYEEDMISLFEEEIKA
jgi:hypothetical protein